MTNIVQAIAAVVLLLAAGAGVIGYFKANVSKSTIELYKEDNEALRTRLSTLELQAMADGAEIKALKASVVNLTAVVTQAEQIRKLMELTEKIAAKVQA